MISKRAIPCGWYLKTMSFFKKIFVVLAMMGLMIPSFVFADDFGLKDATVGTKLINANSTVDANAVPNLIGSIVGVALSFLGAIFFLLILYAGFLWMTAFGAQEKAEKAKSILEHAAVGLVIVLAAYAISRFVFSALGVVGGGNTTSNTGYCSDVAGTCKDTCAGNESVWATPYECAPPVSLCCVPD